MIVRRFSNRPFGPAPKPTDRITFEQRRVLGHADRRREPVSLPVVRGLARVEEASLAHQPEVDLFPGWIRVAKRLMGRTRMGARKARILRYAF